MDDGRVSQEQMAESMREIRERRKVLNRTSNLIRERAKHSGKKIARIILYVVGGLLLLFITGIVLSLFGHGKRENRV